MDERRVRVLSRDIPQRIPRHPMSTRFPMTELDGIKIIPDVNRFRSSKHPSFLPLCPILRTLPLQRNLNLILLHQILNQSLPHTPPISNGKPHRIPGMRTCLGNIGIPTVRFDISSARNSQAGGETTTFGFCGGTLVGDVEVSKQRHSDCHCEICLFLGHTVVVHVQGFAEGDLESLVFVDCLVAVEFRGCR